MIVVQKAMHDLGQVAQRSSPEEKTKMELQNILQKQTISSEESSLQCFMCFPLSNVYETVFPGACFLLWL